MGKRSRILVIGCALAVGSAACVDSSSDTAGDDDEANGVASVGPDAGDAAAASDVRPSDSTPPSPSSGSSGVSALRIVSTWVFTHAQSGAGDALHAGAAAIVDDCLRIGDAIVVWHEVNLEDVQAIVASLEAGDAVTVRVGGGGLSLNEGSTLADFPPEVVERCNTRELWFGAPGPLSIEIDTGDAAAPEPRAGDVGARCAGAGDCAAGLHCRSDFFYERSVCTQSCGDAMACPAGTECVEAIPSFDDGVLGPYCLRPCATSSECEGVLGSECDTYEGLDELRYCF
jgi:hypothetical protein